jgi:fatty-acyl-CoA synthase
MFTLIRKLYRTRLLTIAGLYRLVEGLLATGVNPMVLLRVAAKLHPRRIAVIDEQERLSYPELFSQAEGLACVLSAEFGIRSQQRIAIACRNHAAAIKAIFAFS